ncbi:MAG: hypothetical protein L0177_14055 [Chloroflexi bacterium]|nr:hypothetical protein [Chloroflexota bacterium]
MRILVISGEAFPGHEGRNLPIAYELRKRGHEVRHTGPTHAMHERGFPASTYSPAFASTLEAQEANTQLFSNWVELYKLMWWSDVTLFSNSRGYERAAECARGIGKLALQQRDVGGMNAWPVNPEWLAVRGAWDRGREALMGHQQPGTIHLTGCVQFDSAAPEYRRLSRSEFFQKYGLDESKKLAVVLSSKPTPRSAFVKGMYRHICQAVLDNADYNLIVKPHPSEYGDADEEAISKTPFWKQLDTEAAVCELEDKYDCFSYCDVIISLPTSIFLEAALFRKPMLYVGMPEYWFDLHGFSSERRIRSLPQDRYTPPSRRPYYPLGRMHPAYEKARDPEILNVFSTFKNMKERYPSGYPDYIGTECSIEELSGVLSIEAYRFDDERVYEQYIAEYCHASDGMSFSRVADFVESAIENPALSRKIGRRIWHLGSYSKWRAGASLRSALGKG